MRKTLMLGAVVLMAVAGAVVAAGSGDDPKPVEPPPVVAAKETPAVRTKPDVKRLLTMRPRMMKSYDISIRGGLTSIWNSDGTRLAIAGEHLLVGAESKKTPARILSMVKIVELSSPRIYRQVETSDTDELVGFTTSEKGVITAIRERGLVSGHHQLRFWEREEPNPGQETFHRVVSTVDLDSADTYGYAFAADGKTFRTIAHELDAAGALKAISVQEVDVATGKTIKTLMRTDYKQYALAPNGQRLATIDKDAKVIVYDVDRGTKLSEHALPSPPIVTSISRGPISSDRIDLGFSPGGERLVIARALGQTVVLNAKTGEAMPALEGSELLSANDWFHTFSGDGRLLALTGYSYAAKRYGDMKGAEYEYKAAFLTVWDTRTGKVVKSWQPVNPRQMAFNPVRPILAILEPNGENKTRLGLWDFSAEVEKK